MIGTDEIENSSNALKVLNSEILKEYEFKLPFSNEDRLIIEILKTKAGKSTTGSQTSSVFNTSYDKATEYAETDRNAGVELQKGNLDIIEVGKVYESTLTWTLSEAL